MLLSLCNANAIAVLDIPSRSIVWAAQGVWQAQHDAEPLENGHILLYDNDGAGQKTRVIEFDPVTHAYPWSYPEESARGFFAPHRGMKQSLPNGNVLVVDPEGGRIFEVTSARSLVWEYGCPSAGDGPASHPTVASARRYPSSELKFLEGKPARP